jgi:hypothetical protein
LKSKNFPENVWVTTEFGCEKKPQKSRFVAMISGDSRWPTDVVKLHARKTISKEIT